MVATLSQYRQYPVPNHLDPFIARIGDFIQLIRSGNVYSFHKVMNREIIHDVQLDIKTTDFNTAAFPVAGGPALELGNINEFLEPAPRVYNAMLWGIDSNVPVEVQLFHGGTTGNVGAIKNQNVGFFTPQTSPYRSPRVLVPSYGRQMTPSFRVRNSQPVGGIPIRWLKFKFYGYQHYLSPDFNSALIKKHFSDPANRYHNDFFFPDGKMRPWPERYKTITLRHVVEVGD